MVKKVVSRSTFVDPKLVGTKGTGPRKRLGTVEAIWTCGSCGHAGIPGGTKNCPACGKPKGSEVYQPPAPSAPLLSKQQMDEMGVDPINHDSDEECPFCNSRIKPGTAICPHCSGNIKDAARTSWRCLNCGLESNDVECPSCGSKTELKLVERMSMFGLDSVAEHELRSDQKKGFIGKYWGWLAAIVIVLGIIGALLYFLMPRQEKAVVTTASWTSTVNLQEYQYNQHSGWSIPSGGDYVSESEQIHHYDSVYDHTEEQCHPETQQSGWTTETYQRQDCGYEYSHTERTCYDDGTCDNDAIYDYTCDTVNDTRQVPNYVQVNVCNDVAVYRDEPRYATMYTYSIWEWANISPVVVTGTGFEPRWPNDYLIDETHRESGRTQTYAVSFQVDDKVYNYAPQTLEEYMLYQVGTEWVITRVGERIKEVKRPEE